ncbi:hypothetical protein L9W92_10515 [Pelotomaculum terephthalicicum JT]|uniref:TM1266 family iron-only hydrogenase system putative regulator n=1 Tax=Pelotomaculum TaxID=191373 RepID=UPI0009C6F9F2|nr:MULTISPECIES: TM1266 family iron-only hydrogenase system putative regulator [Pelotomaculum]MCG9968484.1 hypothetical protein [Pelotomaculum terephthalicicum JT]OPX88907.1 MAG: hypothetical protein A4E54_01169 [Pelotomaculum sp. PtaB.Bin117]OPY60275.1 MAG: hypothetical protein A4E56_02799 [Pelotomaculum sp. PtaU1.Bin065]
MEKYICIIGILVNQKSENAPKVQQILTKNGSLVLHRSGIPYSKCDRGIINLTVEATPDELDSITKELGSVKDIVVKSMILADGADKLQICNL